MTISDLPDFPIIKQIRDALWNTGDVRGAAVMVGSGFSRFALLNDPSIPAPPLWGDFSSKMERQLYPKGGAPSDPLRLAQEYKADLGGPALDGLIQSLILDEKWEPSALHNSLLSLPWADVLTTNWDTLLERTLLSETERTYDIVRTMGDISRTRAPRIVKLHGSFPANRPFIFTEEDFRTYPRTFAPFVNLSQQVLLENELCLLGFSGEDPNFLQWAGWVRDNLGSASRHIRLVGVLNLSRSRKEMLKQQNVTPIDLSPLVDHLEDDVKHSSAIAIFLEWLATSKPAENHLWQRPSIETFSSSSTLGSKPPSLHDLSMAWKSDRQNFPGWIVTPCEIQASLRRETDRHYPSQAVFSEEVDAGHKIRFLYELTCRHRMAFWPLAKEYLEIIQQSYSSGGDKHLLQRENTQLCAFMMAEARRVSQWGNFDFWASILEQSEDPKAGVELQYEKALRAKQELNFDALENIVEKITGDDPIWKLRQGMLYTVLFRDELAAQCFKSALLEIRNRRSKDKQSVWLLSREAWAAWIYRFVQFERYQHKDEHLVSLSDWPVHYSSKNCDPWKSIQIIQRKTSEEFVKSIDSNTNIDLLFDAGHYRDKSGTVMYINHTEVPSFHLLTRLQETVGIPTSFGSFDVLSTNLERAFAPLERVEILDYYNAASIANKYNEGLINIAFKRIEVAQIPIEIAVNLAAALRKATDYYLSKDRTHEGRNRSVGRVRINIEIISRLCVRESPDNVKLYFLWAFELCNKEAANDWRLYEHIENVMKRCIEALPKSHRKAIAENALFLPLPSERSTNGIDKYWPEIIDEFDKNDFVRPENNLKWASRIDELIEIVDSGGELDRDRAILRLRLLVNSDQLLPDESEKLAKAIWRKTTEDDGWPSTGCIYPHVFLELPQPASIQVKDMFISGVVQKVAEGEVDVDVDTVNILSGGLNRCSSLVSAATEYFPNIFEACLNWQPRVETSTFLSDIKYLNKRDQRAIAIFLSQTLLCEFKTADISVEIKTLWYDKLLDQSCTHWVGTAFEYARLFPQDSDAMIRVIRKALYSGDKDRVAFGNSALQLYIMANKQGLQEVPKNLTSAVISICESLRMISLNQSLNTAVKLVEANVVEDSELLRLSEVAEIIWSEFTYDSEKWNNEHLINLTLIRSQCVKLAKALKEAGLVLDSIEIICREAIGDAVPEVRFAIEVE